MNKLVEIMDQAAKIAAQAPGVGEKLDWHATGFDRAVSDWYVHTVPQDGHCVLIDAAEPALQARTTGDSETSVILMQRTKPNGLTYPQKWAVSHRSPSDLRSRDDLVLTKAKAAGTLFELQKVLSEADVDTPWMPDASVDAVIAPFLLNTLEGEERKNALSELSRVLVNTGRLDMLVLAADEPLDGAYADCQGHFCTSFPLADELCHLLGVAGFHGVALKPLLERPVFILEGAEIRIFAVSAFVGTSGVCLEQGDAAVYLGPWSEVQDDDGHVYPRGVRIAVCAKTAGILQRAPYAGCFEIIRAYDRPDLKDATLFDCNRTAVRSAAETKGRISIGSSMAGSLDPVRDDGCGC
ncbi:MAG: class I SAM-dependent methyltransferase [Pseudomonadota bacterium]